MNIVQYWHSTDIPEEVQALISSWKTQNPLANHQVFNADTALEFLQAYFLPEVCNAFRTISLPAMCSDVFRVAYILKKGGVYVDCGTSCKLPIEQWPIDLSELTLLRKWHGGVCNGIISAPANNPWLQMIWQKIENVLLDRQEGDIYRLTGPFLYHGITEKESRLPEEDLVILLPNTTPESRRITVNDQTDFSPLFSLHNALKHKTRSHWSKLQEIVPLFSQHEHQRMVSAAATTQVDKHLMIHLVHSHAGNTFLREHHSTLSRNTSSTDIDLPLSSVGERPDFDLFINVARQSTEDVISVVVDLTSCMSELNHHKSMLCACLYQFSELCDLFRSSEVIYSAVDQTAAIAAIVSRADSTGHIPNHKPLHTPFHKLKSQSGHDLQPINRTEVIERLLTSPALDYNLLDEALSFFFRSSTMTPLWSTKVIESHTTKAPSGLELNAQEIQKIQTWFAESNIHFFQKYPELDLATLPATGKISP